MARLLTVVYGEALYRAIGEAGKRERMIKELEAAETVWRENPQLALFLSHPGIGREEKEAALTAIFGGRFSQEIMGFFHVVLKKGRQKKIPDMLAYAKICAREEAGIGYVQVTAPTALTEKQKKAIEKRILETTSYTALEMNYGLDSSLAGGLVIRLGDRMADGSLKRKLEQLKQYLEKA